MTDIWPLVHRERRALIEQLREVPPAAWQTPSLCPGWSVHDVLAHLVDDALSTPAGFLGAMLRHRFDFDRVNAAGVAHRRAADPGLTLAAFEAAAGRTTSAPAPRVTRFVEIVVHGEDLRRPLGLTHDYPPAAVTEALHHQVRTPVRFGGGRERLAGYRLVCTDLDLVLGDGPEIHGRGIDLLLALSGRLPWPADLPE